MPLRTEVRAALFDAREAYLPSIYLGLPAAAMVLAGLASRRRLAWVLAALAALAALLALGRFGPVYPLLLRLVPPLGVLRFPVKALVIVAFAWAMLAGIGFEAWTARARRGAARRVGDVGLAVGGLAALASASWTARHAEAMGGMLLDARLSRHPASAVLAPAVAALWAAGMTMALLLASSLGRGRIGRHWALAAAVVLAAELVAVHRDLSPTVAPTFYRDRPPALAALQGPPLGRVYSFDYTEPGKALHYLGHGAYLIKAGTADPPAWLDAAASRAGLFPSALGSWGVETAYGVDALGLYPPPLANLNWTLRKYEETPLHTRLLRLAAVTRVVALHTRGLEDLVPLAVLPTLYVEPLRVLGVPDPLPRAFVVDGVRAAGGARRGRADGAGGGGWPGREARDPTRSFRRGHRGRHGGRARGRLPARAAGRGPLPARRPPDVVRAGGGAGPRHQPRRVAAVEPRHRVRPAAVGRREHAGALPADLAQPRHAPVDVLHAVRPSPSRAGRARRAPAGARAGPGKGGGEP